MDVHGFFKMTWNPWNSAPWCQAFHGLGFGSGLWRNSTSAEGLRSEGWLVNIATSTCAVDHLRTMNTLCELLFTFWEHNGAYLQDGKIWTCFFIFQFKNADGTPHVTDFIVASRESGAVSVYSSGALSDHDQNNQHVNLRGFPGTHPETWLATRIWCQWPAPRDYQTVGGAPEPCCISFSAIYFGTRRYMWINNFI